MALLQVKLAGLKLRSWVRSNGADGDCAAEIRDSTLNEEDFSVVKINDFNQRWTARAKR